MSLDAKVEKEPTRWERIASEQDKNDVCNVGGFEQGFIPNPQGLILRRGKEPIGYILLSFQKYRNALHVQDLAIKENERSAGVSSKLLTAIRQYAIESGATQIAWNPSGQMNSITEKMNPEIDRNTYVIPLEQLDISTLVGRL